MPPSLIWSQTTLEPGGWSELHHWIWWNTGQEITGTIITMIWTIMKPPLGFSEKAFRVLKLVQMLSTDVLWVLGALLCKLRIYHHYIWLLEFFGLPSVNTALMSLYHTQKYVPCTHFRRFERSHFCKFSFKGVISFHLGLRRLRKQGSLHLFYQLLALCLKTGHPNLEFSFLRWEMMVYLLLLFLGSNEIMKFVIAIKKFSLVPKSGKEK